MVPGGGGEELLEGADGRAGFEGDGFDALTRQVGEQAAADVAEVSEGPLLEEEALEAAGGAAERRSNRDKLLLRHSASPPGPEGLF